VRPHRRRESAGRFLILPWAHAGLAAGRPGSNQGLSRSVLLTALAPSLRVGGMPLVRAGSEGIAADRSGVSGGGHPAPNNPAGQDGE